MAGPAHARHDLIEHDQEAVPGAPLVEPLPETLRGRIGGQGGRADRLAEVGRDGLRAGGLQGAVKRVERLLAGGIEAPGAGRNVRVARQIRFEWSLEAGPTR